MFIDLRFFFRYCSPGLPKKINCSHKKKVYKCQEITEREQNTFHEKFYFESSKIEQDNLILKYTVAEKPSRKRPVSDNRGSDSMFVKYFIPCSGKMRQVCQKAFLNTVLVSKSRVLGVVYRHFMLGTAPKESRGGDRRSQIYLSKREAVIAFIKQFKTVDCHYIREKSSRAYLSSDLNITKMHKMYNDSHTLSENVKLSYFRFIFNRKFNLGFGAPATDACSTCISLKEQIKIAKDLKKKVIWQLI